MDENNWSMGPLPNNYDNYVNGICGVVKNGDGKCHEYALKMVRESP